MQKTITLQDSDHDTAEERFVMANGTGRPWLAYKYECERLVTGNQSFAVTSKLFTSDEAMPYSARHQMAGGQNISPALSWAGAPEAAASFAVSMYDLDAPTTVGLAHWLLFNIDPSVTSLPAGAGSERKTRDLPWASPISV